MNLHGIVAGAIGRVNPHISALYMPSSGFTTGADFKQVPSYDGPISITVQVQALTVEDLKKLDNLNIQGSTTSAYLYGLAQGVVRDDSKGGDLLVFNGFEWLVTAILEAWPDWCKVSLARQGRKV